MSVSRRIHRVPGMDLVLTTRYLPLGFHTSMEMGFAMAALPAAPSSIAQEEWLGLLCRAYDGLLSCLGSALSDESPGWTAREFSAAACSLGLAQWMDKKAEAIQGLHSVSIEAAPPILFTTSQQPHSARAEAQQDSNVILIKQVCTSQQRAGSC